MKRLPVILLFLAAVGFLWAWPLPESPEGRLAPREAVRRLAQRADSGDAKALYDLAFLHERGFDSINANPDEALRLYLKSARAGYVPAESYAAFLLLNAPDSAGSHRLAMEMMRHAADAGDPRAANNLGFLLMEAEKPDYGAARVWLGRAADSGLPAAMAMLGDLDRLGLGAPADSAAAELHYMQAIESGLADAQLKLLSMKKNDWEVLPADSILNLGRRLYTGGAPVAGVWLLEKASEAGEAEASALLGDAYSRGVGVGYDHERSLHYYLLAALAGNPSAQFVVGELLDIFPDSLVGRPEPGDNPDPDMMNASYWYERAAAAGVTDAAEATRRLLRDPTLNISCETGSYHNFRK